MHFKEQTHVHVLLPHWFDDSVRLGCRNLPAKEYEWPDPGCLRSLTASQQDGVKENERAHHTLTPEKKARLRYSGHMTNEPLPTGHSTNIWDGRRILLSMSLELPPSRRTAIESGIARCGGIIVPYMTNGGEGTKVEETQNVGKCDILVTKWRSGRAYVKAVRENKTIGTLGWVFYVHATGIVSRPMDQLLHYPIPKKLIEKFSNHEITVTNYTGEAREYLKKLITTMGATFTPSMSGRNTVLIAAYLSGTKTTKAAAWSIPIVNHTWIEDCFIKWRNLTVGVEKYIYFPPGMDFAKLLGER
ncbi:BRCT domain-containing protein, partial [Amanita rubescens]